MSKKRVDDIEKLKAKQKTLLMQNASIGMAGSIAGVVLNLSTGGGFWRGVLFFFVGGVVVGFVPRVLYFIPETNKIDGLIKIEQRSGKKKDEDKRKIEMEEKRKKMKKWQETQRKKAKTWKKNR